MTITLPFEKKKKDSPYGLCLCRMLETKARHGP